MARILIADDVESLRAMLRAVLETAGHTVEEAADGTECLAASDAAHFDLALVDMMMPGLDGIGAVKQLRLSRPDIGIIAMSGGQEGFPAGFSLTMSELYGADRQLLKPFSNAELLKTVDAVLAQKRV